jgi:hypothetical protein
MAVMSHAEFEALLKRIGTATRDVESAGQALVSTARTAIWPLRFMPGPLFPNTIVLLDYVERTIPAIVRALAELGFKPGVPWTLWSHGNTWAGDAIQGRVSAQVGRLTRDGLLTDDYWQGRAADAYNFVLPRQSAALEAIAAHCRTIDDVLTKMAVAIGAFWLALLLIVSSLLVELVIEIAGAATGVGAPAAAGAGAGSVAKFLATLSAVLSAFFAITVGETLPELKNLRQDLHNNAAFPGGNWPQPSETLTADSRLLDGDGLDWRLKI